MLTEAGRETNCVSDKIKIFTDYYEQLYKSSPSPVENIQYDLDDISFPETNIEEQQQMNTDISYTDLESAIQQMNLGNLLALMDSLQNFTKHLKMTFSHIFMK